MAEKSPGSTRLGKLTLALLLISFLFVVAFTVHSAVTGTVIPHQDPTPERREYERFHESISFPLFIGAALSVLASLVVGLSWVLRWFIRRLRSISSQRGTSRDPVEGRA
jgi:hypothetical protein